MGWLGRFRAGAIVAVAPGGVLGGSGELVLSAGGGRECFELVEGGGELGGPGPVVLQS